MSFSKQRLPYTAADSKTYKREYTNDKGLCLIAQYMRVKQDRPMLGGNCYPPDASRPST